MTLTDGATTRDWLEGAEGMQITAYVQSYTSTAVLLRVPDLPAVGARILDTLRKTSIAICREEAAIAESRLATEFQAWDALSDEAFANLEQELAEHGAR